MRPAAGTKVTIPVTEAHIKRGTPCSDSGCAIALAILDAMPDSLGASVSYGGAYEASARLWTGPSSWLRLILSRDAWDFMAAFDEFRPVSPVTITAEVA